MASERDVMMKTTEGKDVTVTVTKATKVTRGKTTMQLQSLKPGTRLVVTTASDESPYTAMLIQVGAAPAAPLKKPRGSV